MKQVIAIVYLILLGAIAVAQQQPANATEQVWSGEEAYWRYVQSHDLRNYMALWSNDFVGWPIVTNHPIHKTDVAAQFQSGRLSQVIAYDLQRESVEIHGPIVTTFYRVKLRLRNADHSEFTATSRLTHTWMKESDVWRIVAGMSADDSAPAATK
jgi:ketosteroid isomerase-like protein